MPQRPTPPFFFLPACPSSRQRRARALAAWALAAIATVSGPAHASPDEDLVPPLQTVSAVDIKRYMGRWYQIAFYPNQFQKQCVGNVTADYKLLPYGQVDVTNACLTADGSTDQASGRARLQQPRFLGIALDEPYSTARLEVRFAPSLLSWLPLVWAPYWVIQLADDYRYAVVSEPTRRYLWVLSRTPRLDPQDYASIKRQLREQGFDVEKLVTQSPAVQVQ